MTAHGRLPDQARLYPMQLSYRTLLTAYLGGALLAAAPLRADVKSFVKPAFPRLAT